MNTMLGVLLEIIFLIFFSLGKSTPAILAICYTSIDKSHNIYIISSQSNTFKVQPPLRPQIITFFCGISAIVITKTYQILISFK